MERLQIPNYMRQYPFVGQDVFLVEEGEPDQVEPKLEISERSWLFDPETFEVIEIPSPPDNVIFGVLQIEGGLEIDEFEIGPEDDFQPQAASSPISPGGGLDVDDLGPEDFDPQAAPSPVSPDGSSDGPLDQIPDLGPELPPVSPDQNDTFDIPPGQEEFPLGIVIVPANVTYTLEDSVQFPDIGPASVQPNCDTPMRQITNVRPRNLYREGEDMERRQQERAQGAATRARRQQIAQMRDTPLRPGRTQMGSAGRKSGRGCIRM